MLRVWRAIIVAALAIYMVWMLYSVILRDIRRARSHRCDLWNASGYLTRVVDGTCMLEVLPGRWIPASALRWSPP